MNSPVSYRPPPVTGHNGDYVLDLHAQWQADPASLPESWQMFFRGFEMAMCPRACIASQRAHLQSQVASLIYAYRSNGHLAAHLDPLSERFPVETIHDLNYRTYGFSESDLNEVFDTGHLSGPARARLGDLISILQATYCGTVGIQYTHIQDKAIRRWLQNEIEPLQGAKSFDRAKRREILRLLAEADLFEAFIHQRYPGHKRFSLQGAETLIPAVHALVELAPDLGVQEIVIGMAHRGRLNMLANILDKSYDLIFSEFEGRVQPDSYGGDGDVKYHLGFSSDHINVGGRSVHLTLTPNPSHLEAVNPVVLGRARAKQRQLHHVRGGSYSPGEAIDRRGVLPLLIHGDAAFAGQGLVAETLNLSQLKGYQVGGTVHFVINNQIGFTTNPRDARSSAYCTDSAMMIEAPVIHVNGDDPDAVVWVTELALRFRQEFHRDIVVDMVCFRRYGHNEADEPAFTQPLMSRRIKNHPPVRNIYTDQMLKAGEIAPDEVSRIESEFQSDLQKHFANHRQEVEFRSHAADPRWKGLEQTYTEKPVITAVSEEMLDKVAAALTRVPPDFHIHPKIARQMAEKQAAYQGDAGIDWAFAEALAFGTLLAEKTPIRLSGQDSARGTFSQRHSVWWDNETEAEYIPLNNISPGQSHFCVYNSPLSEASVLGFDFGYSLAEPRMLILWEAQFGDFSNGAQMIIDQFLVASQSKWQRTSGLVMLLPHGFEGQGAEHSNAYLERYLAACAQDNIQVLNLTEPAQYFHALRRQIRRSFRRPLVLMAPKSMLRHKSAVSKKEAFTGSEFREIVDDPTPPRRPRRIVLCSGKLYYELDEFRIAHKVKDVALIRIEQLYPFRNHIIQRIIGRYKSASEIIWAQEEPKNRGVWSFIRPYLQHLFPQLPLRYIGRGYAAAAATGSLVRHQQEQSSIVESAILGAAVPHDTTVLPELAA
ncbi:MAG: 2-oxoglutarate dehydrogenase E1 component [Calditrichaeota bacterium]|nr:2-oxoglutarate dehydrogenase E1 component [Calditrichota bacterium]